MDSLTYAQRTFEARKASSIPEMRCVLSLLTFKNSALQISIFVVEFFE